MVGSYQSHVPQCCDLAEKYLLAPVQNAVVERTFSFQNIILSPHRNRFLIENVDKKLFVKYTKFFLSEDEIDLVLKQAAFEWCLLKMRQSGHRGV